MPRIDAGEPTVKIEICSDLGLLRGFYNDFEEGKVVGKGGFGVVKRVVKRATNEVFACKVLPKMLTGHSVAPIQQLRHLEMIKREVAVLERLRGARDVVHLDSVYEDEEHVYIVMEYCEGGEMWHRIGLKAYSEATAARILRAALRTLVHCHSRGILHRDIKPGNFMFLSMDESSPIKAVDFGLAVFFDPEELPCRDLGFGGTPWFMAPECLSSAVVPASDVWSVGVMAHQLLTGHLPFDDRKNQESPSLPIVWKSILTEEVNFDKSYWMGVSDEAKDFISHLLNKDPAKRPSAKEALKHPWVRKVRSNATANQLSSSIVEKIKSYGKSSLYRSTVLDMIANELGESGVDPTSGIGFISPARFVSSSLDMSGKSWHGPFKARSNPSCQHCFGQPPGVKSFKPRMLRNLSPLKAVQGSAEGQHRMDSSRPSSKQATKAQLKTMNMMWRTNIPI